MTREILHADLLGRNSFGVAATADRIVEFSDAASLRDYLAAHEDIRQGKLGVLGGGNNILFTEDFHGTLLHPAGEGFSVTGSSGNSVSVRAEAGLDWEKFVERCIGLGLWGTENLTAIPGTVGAAPVQNIGAYGAEAKDIVESVETLDLATLKEVSIAGCHCGFGYRDSIFKGVLKGRAVITAVTFRLSRTPAPPTSATTHSHAKWRMLAGRHWRTYGRPSGGYAARNCPTRPSRATRAASSRTR